MLNLIDRILFLYGNINGVLIKHTDKDGKVSKVHLNEVWFFNKEGKVIEFHQMAAKEMPEQK